MNDEKWTLEAVTEWRLAPEDEPTRLYFEAVLTSPDDKQYMGIMGAAQPWLTAVDPEAFKRAWETTRVGGWTLDELAVEAEKRIGVWGVHRLGYALASAQYFDARAAAEAKTQGSVARRWLTDAGFPASP